MALFALRRLLLSIPLLIGITFVSYVVISLAPGGPSGASGVGRCWQVQGRG